MTPPPSAETTFAAVARPYMSLPDVTTGTGFSGSAGLRLHGRIFAMLVKEQLVVKVPRDRAAELVASGVGAPFDPGHGRLMREWVAVSTAHEREWVQLLEEAFRYADGR